VPQYFLREDLEILHKKIDEVSRDLDRVSLLLGEACQQSSETFHDNAPYEVAVREQIILSRHLQDLLQFQRDVVIVDPPGTFCTVRIGAMVTIQDIATSEIETYKIGSYIVFDYSYEKISYVSPMAQALEGARVGEVRTLNLETRVRTLRVVAIK